MVLIVMFTFSAFFVSPESFDVRIAITSIGFLTIMAFVYVIQEQLPKISYLTWMHWYCFFCFAFVFAVTADVVAVHYFSRHCDEDEKDEEESGKDADKEGEGDKTEESNADAGEDGDEKAPLLDSNAEEGDVEMASTDKKTDEEKVEESSDPQSGKDRLMKQLALLKNLKVWKSINVTEMTRKDIENLDGKMKKGIWSAFAIMNLVMFSIELLQGNLP